VIKTISFQLNIKMIFFQCSMTASICGPDLKCTSVKSDKCALAAATCN